MRFLEFHWNELSGIRCCLKNWQRTRNGDQNEPFKSENQTNEDKSRRTCVAVNDLWMKQRLKTLT